jgi:NhaA family Na+:H+ antiporter
MKKVIKKIFEQEATTGILLAIATVIGLFIANSSYSNNYFEILNLKLPLDIELFDLHKNLSLLDWINDALMAIFFFLIGMELKKEILIGELSSKAKLALPIIAAFGGVICPALIFTYFNWEYKDNLRGFAIPTATDIAFAYGVICLFGKRINNSLKVFLVALAVLDDLIAILIIAIFYTSELKSFYLLISLIPLFILAFLNYRHCGSIISYILLGLILWILILKSGVHATIAGVVCGLFIPLKINLRSKKDHHSPLEIIATKLTPIVNYLILPIFALANAGVKINNFSFEIFTKPIFLGVMLGLFFGKQIGVMLFSFLAIKLKICPLPHKASWLEFYGVAILTGIGFTMSLFICILAFSHNPLAINEIKIAIIIGSVMSAIYGVIVSYVAMRRKFK